MPHKNIRALAKLEEMGGDTDAAKAKYAISDGVAASSKPALTAVVEYPDGKKKSSAHSEAERDEIRAARIAIDVYNAAPANAKKMTQPPADKAGGLTAAQLRAIVLFALPKKKPADVYPHSFDAYPTPEAVAARAMLRARLKKTLHPSAIPEDVPLDPTGTLDYAYDRAIGAFADWEAKYLGTATKIADSAVMKAIFPAGAMAATAAMLTNTRKLIEEITGCRPFSDGDSIIFAVVNGKVEGVAYWTIENPRDEPYARLHNIVVHPSRQLRLDPMATAYKYVGVKLTTEIERRAIEAGCRLIYLTAGTPDVVGFYEKAGYRATESSGGNFHRQASVAVGIDASVALSARGVKPPLGQQLMVKVLHTPVVAITSVRAPVVHLGPLVITPLTPLAPLSPLPLPLLGTPHVVGPPSQSTGSSIAQAKA